MFLNILKRDIKRKRTMNIIVLLFMIVSVVFVSSSANNLMAVTNSLDTYFDKAGVSDYLVIEKNKGNGKHSDEITKELDSVKEVKTEHTIYISDIVSKKKSESKKDSFNISLMVSVDKLSTRIYDENNKEITSVPKGYLYVKNTFLSENNVNIGDTVTASVDNVEKDFIIKGTIKDATFGGALMGTPRYIVNDEDFNYFNNSDIKDSNRGRLVYIYTEDTDAVSKAISDCPHLVFQGNKDMIKTSYIMDILLAGIMLIVSVFLIIIALVILRFTITFTLTEEYKQIGIMKAIGIRNLKIRSLYLIKYFAISVVGAVVGFAISIPFGNMMLKETSETIMLTSSGGFIYSILATILLVGIVMLFCFRCTRKVKKFTPVDAIRSGSNGERFKRKSLIRLHKSHLRPVPFMSINDIFSNIKRFSIMLVTFTVGILLITIVANTAATLSSPSLTTLFGQNECNVCLHEKNNSDAVNYFAEDGRTKKQNELDKIKNTLADNKIKADIFEELVFMFNVENKNGDSYSTRCYQGINTKVKDYVYSEGKFPVNENEIAITRQTAEKFSVGIGDTLIVDSIDSKEEYLITGYFQTMNNLGEGIRFNEKKDFNFKYLVGTFDTQVRYTDNPTAEEIEKRFDKIGEILPEYKVITPEENIENSLGGITDSVDSMKYFILIIVCLINILVAVLMEKSFLTKEKGEIAILKAMGFKNRSIVMWQTLRIAIIMIASVIIGVALTNPLSQVSSGLVFNMMGAEKITFVNDIMNAYILFPLIILGVVMLSTALTAVSIRNIKTSEINSIE